MLAAQKDKLVTDLELVNLFQQALCGVNKFKLPAFELAGLVLAHAF